MARDTRGNQIKNSRIVLSVDAMGGDLGPPAVVAGIARSANNNPRLSFILHGPEDILRRRFREGIQRVSRVYKDDRGEGGATFGL